MTGTAGPSWGRLQIGPVSGHGGRWSEEGIRTGSGDVGGYRKKPGQAGGASVYSRIKITGQDKANGAWGQGMSGTVS